MCENDTPEYAWYYYLVFDPPELVWLCKECAAEMGENIQFANTDSLYDGECWFCLEKALEHEAAVEEERLWRELELETELAEELYFESSCYYCEETW